MPTNLRGFPARHLTIAAAASATAGAALLVVLAVPSASAVPASDSQGYVDSTARCTSPDTAAAFGSTATSRVAICKTSGGAYEYRGVRVKDGAKLIITAARSGDGPFVAKNDGITYTVTASSLEVSAGSEVIREESWVDYHGPQTGAASAPSAPSAPDTTPTTPIPAGPRLPAEVGGSG